MDTVSIPNTPQAAPDEKMQLVPNAVPDSVFQQGEARHVASMKQTADSADIEATKARIAAMQAETQKPAPSAPTKDEALQKVADDANQIQTPTAKLPDKVAPSVDNPNMGAEKKVDLTRELDTPIEGFTRGAAVTLLKGAQDVWNVTAEVTNLTHDKTLGQATFADNIPVADDMATKGGVLAAQYVAPMVLTGGLPGIATKGATVMAKTFGTLATGALTGAMTDPDQERLSDVMIKNYPWMRGTVADFFAAKPGDNEAVKRLKTLGEAITVQSGLGAAFSGAVSASKWARVAFGKDPAMAQQMEEFAKTLPKNATAEELMQHLQIESQKAAETAGSGATVTTGKGEMTLVPSTAEETKPFVQKAVDSILAPNTEKSPGTLNMMTMSGSSSPLVQDAASEIVAGLQEKIAEGRTGTISWDDMDRAGLKYLQSRPEDFASLVKNHVPGTAYTHEEFSAIKLFTQGAMQDLQDLNTEAAALKNKNFWEYTDEDHKLLSAAQSKIDVLKTMAPVFAGAYQIPGQQLAYLQSVLPSLERGAKGMEQVMQHLRLSGDPQQVMQNAEKLVQAIHAGGNSELGKVTLFNNMAKFAGGAEKAINETALSGMVSGGKTMLRVATAGFCQNAINEMALGNRALFGGIMPTAAGGLTDQALMKARTEWWARMMGMKGSAMEAFGAAADTIKNGKSPVSAFNFAPPQWKQTLSDKAAALSWGDNVAKKFLFETADAAAKAHTMVVDYSSRGVHAAESMTAAFARRQSYIGDAALEALDHGLGKADAAEYVQARSWNPSQAMVDKADQTAKEATMTASYDSLLPPNSWGTKSPSLNGAVTGIDQTISSLPFGKIITPFMKVAVNEVVQTVETSPMAFLSPRVRGMLSAGGEERAKAVSRMMVGAEIVGVVGALDMSGVISLTGTRPDNPEMNRALLNNDSGYQPESMKIGDTRINYSSLGTLGKFISAYADLREFSRSGSPEDTKRYGHMLMAMGAEYFTPRQLTQDIPETLDMLSSIGKDGKKPPTAEELANIAMRFMPASGMLKTLRDLTDPLQREKHDQDSAWQTFKNTVCNQTPGCSSSLPPLRNRFAEVVHDPHYFGVDAISPWQTADADPAHQDKVSSELQRLGLWNRQFINPPDGSRAFDIGMPPRTIAFNVPDDKSNVVGRVPIKLSPQEYDLFVQYAAGTKTPRGIINTEALAAADWNPGERDKFLRENTSPTGKTIPLKTQLQAMFVNPQPYYGGLGPNATQDQKDERLRWGVKNLVASYDKAAVSMMYADKAAVAKANKGIMDRFNAFGVQTQSIQPSIYRGGQ